MKGKLSPFILKRERHLILCLQILLDSRYKGNWFPFVSESFLYFIGVPVFRTDDSTTILSLYEITGATVPFKESFFL